MKITSGDFFAGGGGVTYAMTQIPDLKCQWVLNHDPVAIKTNVHNNKGVKAYLADFFTQDEKEIDPVDFVWASIECTQHSRANSQKEKKIGSYTMGWEFYRYAKHLLPPLIGIENVPEFKLWGPTGKRGKPLKSKRGQEFKRWKQAICDLGYDYSELICNAADYGIPTRRTRFFCFFHKRELGMTINWPKPTHNREGTNGLQKWLPCRPYIDLQDEGQSIFGRRFNENLKKHVRRPLVENTLKRIAGGIKKYHSDMYFLMQYYGTGMNVESIDNPCPPCTTKDRHVLLKMEKLQFIQDYCNGKNIYNNINEPMSPQMTWQTKHFISMSYNSNGNPAANNYSLDEPMWSMTNKEKAQFISSYFNSGGNPGTQNQSLDSPMNAVLTEPNKKALITAIQNGEIDFDIKMRFLKPGELGDISSFPPGYFTSKELSLSVKEATRLIGNAVPPEWARIIIAPAVKELQRVLTKIK